jgi:hypothetical protein
MQRSNEGAAHPVVPGGVRVPGASLAALACREDKRLRSTTRSSRSWRTRTESVIVLQRKNRPEAARYPRGVAVGHPGSQGSCEIRCLTGE